MKTTLRILIMLLLCMTICLCLGSAAFAETVASGTCGDNVNWSLDDVGTLTISGEGAMANYANPSDAPYADKDIYAIVIEEGVTSVGKNAFAGMFLDNVTLPESLTGIGENAFYGAAITEAHFAGNLKQWEKETIIVTGNNALMAVITCEKDVTYYGEGYYLANGVVTATVSVLPEEFKEEYNDYVYEVVFEDVCEIGR